MKTAHEAISAIRDEIRRRTSKINPHESADMINGRVYELRNLLSFLDTIEAKQPSLPEGLDEAAAKYEEKATEIALRNSSPFEEELNGPAPTYSDAFKVGAKWMAGQGETHEHFVVRKVADYDVGPAIVVYLDTFDIGDKVIVQIRKK